MRFQSSWHKEPFSLKGSELCKAPHNVSSTQNLFTEQINCAHQREQLHKKHTRAHPVQACTRAQAGRVLPSPAQASCHMKALGPLGAGLSRHVAVHRQRKRGGAGRGSCERVGERVGEGGGERGPDGGQSAGRKRAASPQRSIGPSVGLRDASEGARSGSKPTQGTIRK